MTTRADRRMSVATHIRRQLVESENGAPHAASKQQASTRHQTIQQQAGAEIYRRVRSKCTDRDITAALLLLTSNNSFMPPSEETLDALRRKHPPAPDDEALPSPPRSAVESVPLVATEKQMVSAVMTMPLGSKASD